MTPNSLKRIANEFRKGVLVDRPSRKMCFAVCAPLQGYLALLGIDTELVEGEINSFNDWSNHYWLQLIDGNILDPTADQFVSPHGKKMPKIYLGIKPDWYIPVSRVTGRAPAMEPRR